MSAEVSKAGNSRIHRLRATDVIRAAAIIRESPGAAQWSAESLGESLSAGFLGWVAERGVEVAGILIGRMVADEFEILNLAVAVEHRRQGIAASLIDGALEAVKSEGCRVAHLEVRASNAPAIALYRGRGFTETGRRKQYYQNPAEDALLLGLPLWKNMNGM
jgi:[ribosomal protein S18]-alanine N-acetyltransferase